MSKRATYKVENPEKAEYWIPCIECNNETAHKVLTNVRVNDSSPDYGIQIFDDYKVLQCGGCKSISFCHVSTCTENERYDHITGNVELVPTEKIYPSRLVGRSELKHLYHLPQPVYQTYKETHAALCNNLPVLVGIGLRAIIEAVSKDRSATGNNLKELIDSLAAMGLIPDDGAIILHSLRFMGNDAAHEAKAHTESELDTAFDVIEHLLQGTYILPGQASKLPQKNP